MTKKTNKKNHSSLLEENGLDENKMKEKAGRERKGQLEFLLKHKFKNIQICKKKNSNKIK